MTTQAEDPANRLQRTTPARLFEVILQGLDTHASWSRLFWATVEPRIVFASSTQLRGYVAIVHLEL